MLYVHVLVKRGRCNTQHRPGLKAAPSLCKHANTSYKEKLCFELPSQTRCTRGGGVLVPPVAATISQSISRKSNLNLNFTDAQPLGTCVCCLECVRKETHPLCRPIDIWQFTTSATSVCVYCSLVNQYICINLYHLDGNHLTSTFISAVALT